MAKTRMVNTRIWNDSWVSNLDPVEKLLFIYCLTNEHTNICGIYELPMKIAAIETGIDISMFEKIFPRLQPKIFFFKGWVIIPNFPKYQSSGIPTVQKGIDIALRSVPGNILSEAIAYGYPIDTPTKYLDSDSDFKLATNVAEPIRVVKVQDQDKDEPEPRTRKDTTYLRVFELWGKYPLNWKQNRTEIVAGQNILAEHGLEKAAKALKFYREHADVPDCPQILKPSDLDRKWVNLLAFRGRV